MDPKQQQRQRKQRRDRQRGAQWAQVFAALDDVVHWKAVRWLFAQNYNSHQPWPCQKHTKVRALESATVLLVEMGGTFDGPASRPTDPAWAVFLEAAKKPSFDLKAAILVQVIIQFVESKYDYYDLQDRPKLRELRKEISRLRNRMIDMDVQQTANSNHWVPGRGYVIPKKKRRKKPEQK